jgi:hypothetical protein
MAVGLLLDASVFIAAELGRPLRRRPEGQARVGRSFQTRANFQELQAAEPRLSVALV